MCCFGERWVGWGDYSGFVDTFLFKTWIPPPPHSEVYLGFFVVLRPIREIVNHMGTSKVH